MKKILFISPSYRSKLLEKLRVLAIPPLSLTTLAAHTPEEYEVQIVDEAVEDIDFGVHADLVAITCMTPLAPRAYDIAARFRERGVPVVLGGIHVSMMPDEAARYADAIVIGEAERLWPALLTDFSKGALKAVYRDSSPPDIENLPKPRRELLTGDYFVHTMQTSRGCPHNCNFCSVTLFNGGRSRLRNMDKVVEEAREIKGKRFFIIDDNIIGSGTKSFDRTFDLFARLKDIGKEWAGQTCLNIVEQDGLLAAASKSGARVFLIGFESIVPEALASMGKSVNLRPNTRNFKEAVKKIHDHGIAIVGGFMFGTDHDTKDCFDATAEFILDAGIDAVQLSIQTPLPGTALYKRLAEEKRLLYTDYPRDWERYNIFEPVFRPKQMTPDELYDGLIRSYRNVSSFTSSVKRGVRTFVNTRSLFSTGISFFWNYDSYKTIKGTTGAAISRGA
ncbi:MAG: radical SAM protein [Deltaproteobacteria bacterium]